MSDYNYQFEDMKFTQDGIDELLVYDRYAIPSADVSKMEEGDIVVATVEGYPKVGVIKQKFYDSKKLVTSVEVILRDETVITVDKNHIIKPLDTTPQHFWDRWAKAAASVEKKEKQGEVEDEFKWLFDGYRYSPGGRIQLMLGQEYRSIVPKRANLSAYNCSVNFSPKIKKEDWKAIKSFPSMAYDAWIAILEVALEEVNIMRRGSGDGINCSTLPPSLYSPKVKKNNIVFYLDKNHSDYLELQDALALGKFSSACVSSEKNDLIQSNDRYKNEIHVEDSIESIMNSLQDMVLYSYTRSNRPIIIDFNALRPRGAFVSGVNGRSSGAVSWMQLFAVVAEILSMGEIDAVDIMEIYTTITLLIEQGGTR